MRNVNKTSESLITFMVSEYLLNNTKVSINRTIIHETWVPGKSEWLECCELNMLKAICWWTNIGDGWRRNWRLEWRRCLELFGLRRQNNGKYDIRIGGKKHTKECNGKTTLKIYNCHSEISTKVNEEENTDINDSKWQDTCHNKIRTRKLYEWRQ